MLEHRFLLDDAVRNRAFRRAIRAQVKPGDRVFDLGCGMGVLGFFALQAGAAHVFGVDADEVLDSARDLAAANGWADRTDYRRAAAADVRPPRRADWLLVEWLGPMGLNEWPLASLADSVRRFLRPGGATIPARVDHYVAPVEAGAAWEETVGFWSGARYGLDLRLGKALAVRRAHPVGIPPDALLAPAARWLSLNLRSLDREEPLPAEGGEASFDLPRDGLFHGLACWFEADLGARVRLTNAPGAPPTHWNQAFLPLPRPVRTRAGDRLEVRLGACTVGRRSGPVWSIGMFRGARRVLFHEAPGPASTLSIDEAARLTGNFVPLRGPAEERLALLLSLPDGRLSAREAAAEAARLRPDLFAGEEEALAGLVRAWRGRPLRAGAK